MIEASAPVRICDIGGWTDTWFGGPGRVVNIAVRPGVEASIRLGTGPEPVVLDVAAYGDRYPLMPAERRVPRHPLLEAAIDALPPPADLAVEISVRSLVPVGSGAGTSAAVAVVLLGALAAARSEDLSPRDAATMAHRLEVDILGVESGIQDQLSAAFGGINYLEIDEYPDASVHPLPAWDDLGPLLSLVFLGRPHDSSDVHLKVIERVGGGGGDEVFSRLRGAATAARDAVRSHDLEAFGRAMVTNTEAQAALHDELVGADARRVIEAAAAHGARGWKVNGAGGDGGSVTLLSASRPARDALDQRIATLDARYQVLPVAISRSGLDVRGAV